MRGRTEGRKTVANPAPAWRLGVVLLVVSGLFGVGAWKVLDLQVVDNDFLQYQGDVRTVRNDMLPAHRGNIMDRNGKPLAISTPVQSLWLNPKEVLQHPQEWPDLAAALETIGVNPDVLRNRIRENAEREFLYIKRRLTPAEANAVLRVDATGIYAQEEYKRYYPMGEVAGHILGITNADDVGQEGLELAYDDWLRGTPGSRRVLKDRLGGIIRELQINEVARPGNDLELSIDSRIQYIAYKALKEDVTKRGAKSGTAVVLDVRSGEVLAVVNQPSFNPNNRSGMTGAEMRNRAMVDLVEPGSTAKTFAITAALESGLFDTSSIIDTNPGYVRVDRTTIKDPRNYGLVDLERILTKSSQVGATKVALTLGEQPILDVLGRVGLGQAINTGFPGEAAGVLPYRNRWAKSEVATLAYGYGFHVSPLQLAQAYLVYANHGVRKPVSLLKAQGEVAGQRVIDEDIARRVASMLETVISQEEGGTGTRAAIPGYRVAGKTGTAWFYDVKKGGYDNERYVSLFAGFVPASDPRIVVVVTVTEPQGEEQGGGAVAAPVFAKIAAGAMRVLNVPPDNLPQPEPPVEQLTAVPVAPLQQAASWSLP